MVIKYKLFGFLSLLTLALLICLPVFAADDPQIKCGCIYPTETKHLTMEEAPDVSTVSAVCEAYCENWAADQSFDPAVRRYYGYATSGWDCKCRIESYITVKQSECKLDILKGSKCPDNTDYVQAYGPTETEAGAPTGAPAVIKLQPPFGQAGSEPVSYLQNIMGKIINYALGLTGSIALLMFVIGGVLWLTAAGNPDRIKQGKGILLWAAIGLVIIFSAYAITNFVLRAILVGR